MLALSSNRRHRKKNKKKETKETKDKEIGHHNDYATIASKKISTKKYCCKFRSDEHHPYALYISEIRQRADQMRSSLLIHNHNNGLHRNQIPTAVQCHIISWLSLHEHTAVASTCTALQHVCRSRASFYQSAAYNNNSGHAASAAQITMDDDKRRSNKNYKNHKNDINGHFEYYATEFGKIDQLPHRYPRYTYFNDEINQQKLTGYQRYFQQRRNRLENDDEFPYDHIVKYLKEAEISALSIASGDLYLDYYSPTFRRTQLEEHLNKDSAARNYLRWLKSLVVIQPSSLSVCDRDVPIAFKVTQTCRRITFPVGVLCALGPTLVSLVVDSWRNLYTETSGAWLHRPEFRQLRSLTVRESKGNWRTHYLLAGAKVDKEVTPSHLVPRHVRELTLTNVNRRFLVNIPYWITSLTLQFSDKYRIDGIFNHMSSLASLHLRFLPTHWLNEEQILHVLKTLSKTATPMLQTLSVEFDPPLVPIFVQALHAMQIMPHICRLTIPVAEYVTISLVARIFPNAFIIWAIKKN